MTQIQTRNLKFLIAYAFLVALPVLGLVGVLKAGRVLTAPLSVDGIWKIDANATRLGAMLPCIDKDFLQDASLSIMQSGRNLVLSVNSGSKVAASGFIEGHTIHVSAMPAWKYSGGPGCADHLFSVKGTVEAESDPRSLFGTMIIDGCSSCAPVEFHAIRQMPSLSKGGH